MSGAASLLKFVPDIVGWFGGDKAEEVAETVVSIGEQITGVSSEDPDEIVSTLETNPEMLVQFKEAVFSYQLGLEKEETERLREKTKQLTEINATMRAESVSDKWPQYTWRPFNGFMFGTTLFFDYIMSQLLLPVLQSFLNLTTISWEHIPTPVYMLWTGVLGVNGVTRGLEKANKAKSDSGSYSKKDFLKDTIRGAIGL